MADRLSEIEALRSRVRELEEALRALVLETEQKDNPYDLGVSAHSDVMERVRAVLSGEKEESND